MPDVVIVLGSSSDKKRIKGVNAAKMLAQAEITCEVAAVSAHRHSEVLRQKVERWIGEGTKIFIGVAGMAADLPKTIASYAEMRATVIGVGLTSDTLAGLDALLSITRTPPGVPVLTAGLDQAGFDNAVFAAVQILTAQGIGLRSGFASYIQEASKQPEYNIDLAQMGQHDAATA